MYFKFPKVSSSSNILGIVEQINSHSVLFSFFWLCWVSVAAQAFSSCGERGLLFVVVHGLLIVVVFLVAECRI